MQTRTLASLAVAALLAAPAAAQAQSANRHEARPWIGGAIGVETGDLDGIQLRGDLEYPFQRLAPQVMLSGVGSVSYSHLSQNSSDLDELALTPAVRFTFDPTPVVGIYGDVGLGLYYANVHVPGNSNSDVGLLMRLGVGAYYQINNTVRLGGELGFRPHFGDYNDTTTTLLFSAMFRL